MKAISGEVQHALVIADIYKKKIRNVVRKSHIERSEISLMEDEKISKRLEENVIKLVEGGA